MTDLEVFRQERPQTQAAAVGAEKPPARGAMALVVGAALLVSLPSLFMGLHADDWFLIQPRPWSQTLATFLGDWNRGEQGIGGFYRPLVRLSFALDQRLFGEAAWGYHFINALLFVVCSVFTYRVAGRLAGGEYRAGAIWCVTLLAANPLKSEALFWVSGRTDLWAATLVMASLWAACRALERDSWSWVAASLGLLAAGLMAKEMAIAGCAVVPLAAALLAPPDGRRMPRMGLLLGPLLLAILYLAFRAFVLGGIAGYSGVTDARPVSAFARPLGSMLSAIWWPWQAEGAATFSLWRAVPGLVAVCGLVLLGGFRRGPVFAALGLVVSLLPATFISIGPADGTRVLMLPLCLQVALLASLFSSGCLSRLLPLVITISLLPDQVAIAREFLEARRFSDAALEHLYAELTQTPEGGVLVVPEPVRVHDRRILDAVDASDMALWALWLHREPSAEAELVVEAEPLRFGVTLKRPGGSVFVTTRLQPWMAEARLLTLNHNPASGVQVAELRREGGMQEPVLAEQEGVWVHRFDEVTSATRLVAELQAEGGESGAWEMELLREIEPTTVTLNLSWYRINHKRTALGEATVQKPEYWTALVLKPVAKSEALRLPLLRYSAYKLEP